MYDIYIIFLLIENLFKNYYDIFENPKKGNLTSWGMSNFDQNLCHEVSNGFAMQKLLRKLKCN